jgi:hypothetical protein
MDRDTSTMSFGDHLEDLRKRLFYSLLGPIPILIVCLVFGGPILEFIVIPLETQLRASGQPVRLLATSPIESFGAYLKVDSVPGVAFRRAGALSERKAIRLFPDAGQRRVNRDGDGVSVLRDAAGDAALLHCLWFIDGADERGHGAAA